jgi:hypothetical protein
MVIFNTLKIYINANEAKPGGLIGAMLSPYLFSINMNDFCKKFNEQTKDYLIDVCLAVKLYCNVKEKTYTFIIKNLDISFFIIYYLSFFRKFTVIFLFDVIKYYSLKYTLSLYRSARIILSMLKLFKKRKFIITIKKFFFKKFSYWMQSNFFIYKNKK